MPTSRAVAKPKARGAKELLPRWELTLYVTGGTARAAVAIANLRKICEEHGTVRHWIRVVDVLKAPDRCRKDQIIAVPTVVRRWPQPERRVIGTLTDSATAAATLGLSE